MRHPGALAARTAAILPDRLKLDLPVNPPDIVSIDGDEFIVNMNNMKPLTPYLLEFMDSRYVIWKNQDGALVIDEV